jgi:hypothetical protein
MQALDIEAEGYSPSYKRGGDKRISRIQEFQASLGNTTRPVSDEKVEEKKKERKKEEEEEEEGEGEEERRQR